MSDFKYQLRKVGFPQCAKDSLQFIEQLIVSHNTGRNVIQNTTELAMEIISEFVFCERKKAEKGKVVVLKNISSIQELQLLEILTGYFSMACGSGTPMVDPLALRSAVFMFLFPSNDESRIPLLVRLVSMAIATRSSQVLALAGTWLLQTGPTSPNGLALAKNIVNDYLVLVPEAVEQLHDLPHVHIAFEFTACFLCAVAQLYECTDSLPPQALLQVVALWSNKLPQLCTAALSSTLPPTSPFLGLVRWCVMAPLLGDTDSEKYSSLNLSLLESILSRKQDNLVTVHQLVSLIVPMMNKLPHANKTAVNQSLDRLVQIIIVLLRTGSVTGNLVELFQRLDALPKNDLLECFAYNRSYITNQPFLRISTRL